MSAKLGPVDFQTQWQVHRQITDRHGSASGTFSGQAVFAPKDDQLLYTETGCLTLATGARMRAERQYLWCFDDGGVTVRFADGAAFHSFATTAQPIGTPHLCGADLYQCHYDFTAWPCWQAVWHVTGPRKDYTSQTEYQPCR